MSYCTLQNMIDRYGEDELLSLSDRHQVGAIDTDVIDRAIADAAGEIDGYLDGRYRLPVNPVPKVLERIACDVARYYLYDDQVSEQVQKRYDDAVAFLKSVAKGDITLGIDAVGAKPATGSNGAQMTTAPSVFSRKDNGFL